MIRRTLARLWAFVLVLDDHDATGAASAMAFHAFLSLVPLFALAGFATHAVLHTDAGAFAPLFRLTPVAVSTLADREIMRLSDDGGALLPPLSVVAFLWISSGGIARAMLQLELVFVRPPRRWHERRALAMLFVVVMLLATAVAIGVGLLVARRAPSAFGLASLLLPFLGLWSLVGLFFRYATRRDEGAPRHGFRGALVTLACWALLSFLFSTYVRELSNYSRFYGGVAAVAVLFFWLWLMSLALIVGAEVNARLEGTRPPLSRRLRVSDLG
ncbi:MAG: YihY/virulence factor BrkB family protein [Deltaproteobacteria bacterium]|nr:YihY/virulence factor BrkB family protein [Deltaproteobacteria bacterium]